MSEIKDLIKQMGKRPGKLSTIENARVLSVKKSDSTCKVVLLDADLELEVKLKSITAGADDLGFIAYPKKGSIVSIAMIDNDPNDYRLLDCTEIDSAVLKVGAIKLKLNNTGIVELSFVQLILGAGGFGGLPKIAPLVKNMNALEQKVNDIASALASHKHGAAGTPPAPPITIAALDKTKKDDLENKDITQ